MAKTKKPAGNRTIIDVAHPGQSAPSSNSKSVIISNRPLLKDPMMVDDAASQDDGSADSSLAKVSNKSDAQPSTAPLLETEKPEEETIAEDTEKPAEPPIEAVTAKPIEKADDKPAPESDAVAASETATDQSAEAVESAAPPEPQQPSEPPDETANKAADNKPAAKGPQADQPAAEKPGRPAPTEPEPKSSEADSKEPSPKDKTKPEPAEAEAAKAAKHQAAIDKLADSKKYYLPINAVEKRRSRRFVILGIILSLLLIVAWADIALDAGLIHLQGIKPLTHFFSN